MKAERPCKKFRKVAIHVTEKLFQRIAAAVESMVQNSRHAPLSRGAWIKRAILRALDHRQRSNRSRAGHRKCPTCGRGMRENGKAGNE